MSEYTKDDMVRDFLNPAEYVKTSALNERGNLTVKTVALTNSEKYGDSYAVTFEDVDGNAILSYISAKHPYAIFDEFKEAMVGCVVAFNKVNAKDGKTIIKMRLIQATDAFKALL